MNNTDNLLKSTWKSWFLTWIPGLSFDTHLEIVAQVPLIFLFCSNSNPYGRWIIQQDSSEHFLSNSFLHLEIGSYLVLKYLEIHFWKFFKSLRIWKLNCIKWQPPVMKNDKKEWSDKTPLNYLCFYSFSLRDNCVMWNEFINQCLS